MSRYRCVDARKAEQFPVAAACGAAGVSTSAYYAWVASCARGPAAAELAEQQVVAEIRAIHADSDGVYGSPRVTAELRRRGRQVNHKRVERLMRAHELVGHRPHRRRSLTKPGHQHLTRAGPAGPTVRPRPAQRCLVRRHHLHPDQ